MKCLSVQLCVRAESILAWYLLAKEARSPKSGIVKNPLFEFFPNHTPTLTLLKYFFEILSDLNPAVPNHLADESTCTSQTREPDAQPDHHYLNTATLTLIPIRKRKRLQKSLQKSLQKIFRALNCSLKLLLSETSYLPWVCEGSSKR